MELAKGTGLSEAFVGWVTGWLNLLGQIGLTASVASGLANHIAAMWVVYNGHVFEQEELLLTYAGGPACLAPALQEAQTSYPWLAAEHAGTSWSTLRSGLYSVSEWSKVPVL